MPAILINEKNCFYQDIGEGYPILLGHSYLWTSHMWEPQLKTLSQEFRCLAVDLWSHGQSENLGVKNYTIEQLADDYWSFMKQLGISKFAVIGLSVGGMWGAHLALNHPYAVSALVLMDTFVGSEPKATKLKYFMLLDLIEKKEGFTNILLDQITPLFFSPYTLNNQPQLVDDFRNALGSIKKENIPGIVALGKAIFSRNCILNQLKEIKQPTLVLVGQDDIPRPLKEAKEMVRYLPKAELNVIDNAGHISNLEQPELVNSALLNFLRKACTV
jgi:pimeloyl-ACP methyl ester carboxylesterase